MLCSHHRTVEATVTLLEISVACGAEAQQQVCTSIFQPLWQASGGTGPAVCAAAPAAVQGNIPADIHPPGIPAIPRGRAGDQFLEVWLEELKLERILEDLEE